MGIIPGLSAALCWGAADFLAPNLTQIIYLLANFAFTTEQIAIVSVLASLFSAVTVLLAWIFLHDKLQWSQWLGIGIIFVGVVLVKL